MENYLFICFCILSTVLGACFGSFANVLIYRIPRGESVIRGASHCPHCNNTVKAYDNIPILSYLILRGRCRYCNKRISPRYVIVEALCMLIWLGFSLTAKEFGYAYAVSGMVFSFLVIAAAFTDLENGIIPDRYNIAIAVLGVSACILGIFFDTFISWYSRLIGLGFAVIFFGGTYLISRAILKREGIGFGDVKFMSACGLYLGIKAAFTATLIGCVLAAIVLTAIAVKNKESKREYPFAPFLGAGVIIASFVGEILINAYLGLF